MINLDDIIEAIFLTISALFSGIIIVSESLSDCRRIIFPLRFFANSLILNPETGEKLCDTKRLRFG